MAEFALGLTKTAVEGTLSRVRSAIEEERKLKVRVQNDLVFITAEFEMMHSFLKVANAERARNEVVRTWVRQVRDLAFDVEDCVEFVVHLDNKSWAWLWRLASSCISMIPPLPLDVAVDQIKQLKARVEDVSQRNTRYSLMGINDSGSNTNSNPGIVSSSTASEFTSSATAAGTSTAFHILSEVWEAAGRRRSIADLRNLLMSEGSDLQVISLWGNSSAGGEDLGMTGIIRKAYCDPEICQEFDSRAWVKLMQPFNLDEFLNSLLTQFFPPSSSHHHPHSNIRGAEFRKEMRAAVARGDDLKKAELMQQVSDEQSYLVILEKVSTVVEWDAIRMHLPDSNNGSRIVVSTQQLGIALLCTGEPYQVSELGRFSSDNQSISALSKKAPVYNEGRKKDSRSKRKKLARDWTNEIELVGRQDEGNYLGRCLLEPGVTAVWGISGVGKSAIVRTIYYGIMLGLQSKYWFRNGMTTYYMCIDTTKYSWVDVSHPFNLMDFSRRLLLDFHSDDPEAMEIAAIGMMEGQDPIQRCCRLVREDKCFVVIDGLSSTHDWDLIKNAFLSENIKSCIVVITNEAKVATHCATDQTKVLNIKSLGADVASPLFTKKYWGNMKMTQDMEGLSKLVMAKCGGLPKVISAIAEQNTTESMSETFLMHLNDDFMDTLDTDPGFHSLRGLFGWMQSYFDSCSDELKPCIFYLSVFPLDQNIRRTRLMRRWIAEGYCRDTFAGRITADINGEKLFSELIKLSIIQQQSRGSSKVNGFFHEYIISRPMEDNLVFALEGHSSPNSRRTGQHLTIMSSWGRDENVIKTMDLSRLRSLTVFGEWRPFFISSTKMGLLRVLDLEDTTSGVTNAELEQIGKLLPRLKFLSVRGCKGITRLPDSFGGLRQLQTLNVRHTSIVMLPLAIIIKLEKMQFVRAGTTHEPSDEDDDCTSLVEEDGVETSSLQPQPAAENDKCTQTSSEVMDGGATSSLPTPPPPAEETAAGVVRASIIRSWKSRAVDLVVSSSCLSKKKKLCRPQWLEDDNGGGVDIIPAAVDGIGKLADLRALGVVNLNGAGGRKAIVLIRELKKLNQLRKLGVSGINRNNWQELCLLISGHARLESLSVRFGKKKLQQEQGGGDLFCFGDICEPPKTLKSLKVYGAGQNVRIRPVWIMQLQNLQKIDLEATISKEEDMRALNMPFAGMLRRLCVKPIEEGSGFTFSSANEHLRLQVIKIDCSSIQSSVTFLKAYPVVIEVVKIHYSSGSVSSLEISGLDTLVGLKQVWLTGSYSNDIKQHLKQQISTCHNKPVLKLGVQPPSP